MSRNRIVLGRVISSIAKMNAVSAREKRRVGKWGGGGGIVAQQNNYTALFLITCAVVNVYCPIVIRRSFHALRAFLCTGKVHFSGNVAYFIYLSCAPYVC